MTGSGPSAIRPKKFRKGPAALAMPLYRVAEPDAAPATPPHFGADITWCATAF
jgi:hypothetical protein